MADYQRMYETLRSGMGKAMKKLESYDGAEISEILVNAEIHAKLIYIETEYDDELRRFREKRAKNNIIL